MSVYLDYEFYASRIGSALGLRAHETKHSVSRMELTGCSL